MQVGATLLVGVQMDDLPVKKDPTKLTSRRSKKNDQDERLTITVQRDVQAESRRRKAALEPMYILRYDD